jgi:hypothetical protein
MEWREIADRPADEEAAMAHIKGMIAGRVERLEELIAVHEEIAGEEAAERADAASFDPGAEAERLRRSRAAKSRELRQTLELFLKMQAARERRKTSTTEGTEGTKGRGRPSHECANEADSGRDKGKSMTTEGTEGTEGRGRENQKCANEADSGSREGGIGGRAGEGRTIPGRKRVTARGAAGGLEEGCQGEKRGASEANFEMIKQVMAQRFSDMPAARGPRERSQSAGGCRPGPGGERDGSMAGESAGAGPEGPGAGGRG